MRNNSTSDEPDSIMMEEIQRRHGELSSPLLCDALSTLLWLLLSTTLPTSLQLYQMTLRVITNFNIQNVFRALDLM